MNTNFFMQLQGIDTQSLVKTINIASKILSFYKVPREKLR